MLAMMLAGLASWTGYRRLKPRVTAAADSTTRA
jgi:hypothetical protein